MSTEWTAERLDALPELTMIEWLSRTTYDPPRPQWMVRQDGAWEEVGFLDTYFSGQIIADAEPGSIRVVSAPIDALLTDEAVRAAASEIRCEEAARDEAREALNAAIARVTGDQS